MILKKADLEDKIDDIDKKIAEFDLYLAKFQSLENEIQEKDKAIENLEKKVDVMGDRIVKLESQCADNAFGNTVEVADKLKSMEWKVYKLERKNAGADFC